MHRKIAWEYFEFFFYYIYKHILDQIIKAYITINKPLSTLIGILLN